MNRRPLSWSLLVIALGALPVPAQDQGSILLSPWSELRWRSDYNAARKEAHEKNLPIIIDFGTADCHWCRKLDETTFRDPRVVALMNERFIPLKIDAEREAVLANHLRIDSYPTLVLAGSDGKILAYLKGYQDAESFQNVLQRMIASVQPPEWMQKDFQTALQKIQQGHYAVAIPMLKSILEDGKGKSLQPQAQKYLDAIEQKALESVTAARDLETKGRTQEAIDALEQSMRHYPGLESTRQAGTLVARLKEQAAPARAAALRSAKAQEMIAQAREFHKQRDLVLCIDRCSLLIREYLDLPEGQEASQIMTELKNNPLLLQQAADSLSERLGETYLALAESYLQKGQPQRAEFYFQRVVLACPGSRQAESAQVRLTQVQSLTPRSGSGLTSASDMK